MGKKDGRFSFIQESLITKTGDEATETELIEHNFSENPGGHCGEEDGEGCHESQPTFEIRFEAHAHGDLG